MLAMSDEDSRKSSSPQRSKKETSSTANESKQIAQERNTNANNSVKPNMVYIVSILFNYISILYKEIYIFNIVLT